MADGEPDLTQQHVQVLLVDLQRELAVVKAGRVDVFIAVGMEQLMALDVHDRVQDQTQLLDLFHLCPHDGEIIG